MRLVRQFETEREPRVVYEHVDLGELGRQRAEFASDRRPVAHVEFENVDAVAEIGAKVVEPLDAPATRDHARPIGGESTRGGGAEPRGRTGHEDDQSSLSLVAISRIPSYSALSATTNFLARNKSKRAGVACCVNASRICPSVFASSSLLATQT